MNNILIIGNGFDIANSYKTRYRDFISFIKNKQYGKYKDIKEKKEFIEKSENNSFVRHFITDKKFELWCDVENEMLSIVKSINDVFKDGDEDLHYEYKRSGHKKFVAVTDVSPYTEKVLDEFKLVEYHYSNTIIKDDFFDYVDGIKWNELNEYLTKELADFKKLLVIYLREYVPIICKEENIIVSEETKKQLTEIDPKYIITFNYTDFYEQYYKCKSVNHVHGDVKNENIVLGFNDDEKIDYRYIRFKKYFQRIQNKLKLIDKDDEAFNSKEEFLSELTEEDVLEENVLHFYGLSFDYTDEDYIRELFEKVNNIEIKIYYYNNSDYDLKIMNLMRIFGKDKFYTLLKKIQMIHIV